MVSIDKLKEIDNWLSTYVSGCRFIGLSEDGELFIECTEPNTEFEEAVADKVREIFPLDVKAVIQVFRPSLVELEKTIEELNKLIDNNRPINPLMQIE